MICFLVNLLVLLPPLYYDAEVALRVQKIAIQELEPVDSTMQMMNMKSVIREATVDNPD
jgi:hypothetical protein